MNWTPILIGIAIICYTFAAHFLMRQGVNIYSMVKEPRCRNWSSVFIVSLGLCVTIAIATIGSVALCYF